MNLQKTVSEILGREVSIEEAKEFAVNQFGVLVAFIKKQEQKEVRVFVLSADVIPDDFSMSGYEIENWVGYQEHHNQLTENAKRFIELCEEHGDVYSLYGFHTAFNISSLIGVNDYVFITNLY